MSFCSAVRIWSSWTGAEVWLIGIVSPSDTVGAEGDPGCMSTKKLPSRKMRGRICSLASLCTGRPLSWIAITTRAASAPGRTRSTAVTLPTVTPATRTGEFVRMLFELGKTACSSNCGLRKGMFLLKPRNVPIAMIARVSRPAAKKLMPRLWLRLMAPAPPRPSPEAGGARRRHDPQGCR